MEYILGVGILAVIFYAIKNFLLGAVIKTLDSKDSEFSKEAQIKQAEIADIKKVIEKVKQDETNRPEDQVEDFWNKK
jgi:hypothetical protein